MRRKSFLKDDSARVPFAVIGVFLILISTVVSINLTRLDVNMAKTMSSSLEVGGADDAMKYARGDLARAMNYAGMEAMKRIGETPVIKPDNNSEYYNGTNGNPDDFNRNWARAIIQYTLNEYIGSNYMNDTFVNNKFSVNVERLDSWQDITVEQVNMSLEDRVKPPVLEPYKSYTAYWKISVPFSVHLTDLVTGSELLNKEFTIETVVTS